jgi:hypothetical protein
MSRRNLLAIAVAAATCCTVMPASAADRDPLAARVTLDVGGFFLSTDTRVRVDGATTGRVGTDLDYDDTFGLGDFDRFRVEALWRIARRHSIRAMYFENNRSATRNIARDIHFGDETFPLGASVIARSELAVAQLSYDYAFVRRERYELAGSIGVHMLDVSLSLNATLSGPGGAVAEVVSENATTTAPLPVVGLRAVWRLPHDLYLTAQLQYFQIDFDPYYGSLTDLKAALVWQVTDHFGIGVGYNDFGFRFDIEDEGHFNGRLRWNYGGAIAFVSFMF